MGLMYKPIKDLSIGLTVRSEIQIEMDGTEKRAGTKNKSEVEFTLPYYFTLGLGYEPVPNVTIGFSMTYMLWSGLDKITFTTPNEKIEEETFYDDSWSIGLGIEYRTKKDFIVRAGLSYSQHVQKDKGLDFATCDVGGVVPRVGVAYNITSSLEMNIIGIYAMGIEREYKSKKYDQDNASVVFGFIVKYW